MATLECPHCHQPLNFVVVRVTLCYQKWTITERGMTLSDTDVFKNGEPKCWKCDGLVGTFLKEHGIACEWDEEEEEVNECQHSMDR